MQPFPVGVRGAIRRSCPEPPATYLAHVRLDAAGDLLRNTSVPVGLIAERVGYTSRRHSAGRSSTATARHPLAGDKTYERNHGPPRSRDVTQPFFDTVPERIPVRERRFGRPLAFKAYDPDRRPREANGGLAADQRRLLAFVRRNGQRHVRNRDLRRPWTEPGDPMGPPG